MNNNQARYTMNKLTCLVFLLTSTLLASCTTTPSNQDKVVATLEDMKLEQGEIKDRILNYSIRSWKYVDRKHIILEASRKEYYLISLHTPCFGLSGAIDIGFTSFGSSLSKFEKIVVRDTARPDERCSIKEIIQLVPVQSDNNETTEDEDDK